MIKKLSITGTLIFLTVLLSEGQTFNQKVDSLTTAIQSSSDKEKVLLYDQLSRTYWFSNIDSSLFYANLSVEFAKKTKDDVSLGEAYNSLGNAYSYMRENEKALENYLKSKEYRVKVNDYIKISHSLSNIALVYLDLGMYTEAINTYTEAVDLCEANGGFIQQAYLLLGIAEVYKTISDSNRALEFGIKAANVFIHYKDKLGMASTYNFIGSLHKDLNNVSLALEYYKKAYSIYIELNDEEGISTTSNNLGIVYDELGENTKALEFYNKSLEMARTQNDKKGISTALNNIGYLNAKNKSYNKALESYLESLRISRGMYDYPSEMNTCNNIAWVYYYLGNLEKATEYVLHGLSLESKVQNILFKSESQEILSKIYLKKEMYKEAFEYNAKFMELKDSIFNIDRNEKLIEMQVRFETERKENEIQLLRKNDEIRNLDLRRQKILQWFWFAFSALFVVIAVLIYNNLQSKKKVNALLSDKNQQLEEANQKLKESEEHLKELNATKDKFFSIIAHDLKNPFNALVGFSDYLVNNFEKSTTDEIKEYIHIINDSAQNLSKLLHNLLQWSRTQLGTIVYNPELFPILPMIHQEIEFLENVSENKNLKIIVRVENHHMVFADKNIISSVVRNLLSNAIKFSNQGGRIVVSAQEKDKMVEISIADSGVGISKEDISKLFKLDSSFTTKGTADEVGTGLGLLICKEFVEKNGGSIWVTSQKDKGSVFTFSLPVHRWS